MDYRGAGAGEMEAEMEEVSDVKVCTKVWNSPEEIQVEILLQPVTTVGETKIEIINTHGKQDTINHADHILVLQPTGMELRDDAVTTKSLEDEISAAEKIVVHPREEQPVVAENDVLGKNLIVK